MVKYSRPVFTKGRGTADGMFALRLQLEKKLEDTAIRFIDLEKSYDTIPREMTIATLRCVEVPEAEDRMVEGTQEHTKSRVLHGVGVLGEFKINIDLKYGSALSPLLFIVL